MIQDKESRFHAGFRVRNGQVDQSPEPAPTLDFSKIYRSIDNLTLVNSDVAPNAILVSGS
jgi:hypothetical protein